MVRSCSSWVTSYAHPQLAHDAFLLWRQSPYLQVHLESHKLASPQTYFSPLHPRLQLNMSTGSISDVDEFHDSELLDGLLEFGSGKDTGTSNESTGDSSNCEGASVTECTGKRRKSAAMRKSAPNGVAQEGKQVQRNAANARERARMRVLSKAFSRLKTTLPWVPPDTKLSKLDTLRLASSYIAHLRQILANDKYENGYIHPVNLVRDF